MNRFFLFLLVLSGTLFAQDVSLDEAVPAGADGVPIWKPERHCRIIRKNNAAHIEAVGGPPQLFLPFDLSCENFRTKMRIRTGTESTLEFRWITKQSPRRGSDKMQALPLVADGAWHDYDVSLPVNGTLTGLSIRFTASNGDWEIGSFEMRRQLDPPLSVVKIVPEPATEEKPVPSNMIYTLANTSPGSVTFSIQGSSQKGTLAPGKSMRLLVPFQRIGALGEAVLRVTPEGFGQIAFPAFHYLPEAQVDWLSLPLGEGAVFEVSRDGRVGRVRQGDQLLALVAPLVHRGGVVPLFQPVPTGAEQANAPNTLRFAAPDALLSLEAVGDQIRFHIQPTGPATDAPTAGSASTIASVASAIPSGPFEGPVVRVFGTLRGGLLPGVEFLGPGDMSSSTIDLAEPDNRRPRPSPSWVTIPFSVLATDRVVAALSWGDADLIPCFAAPNTIDSTDDHRMGLSGGIIDATVRFIPATSAAPGDPIPEMIRWGVERFGVPAPDAPPRDAASQRALSLGALQGPLLGEDRMSWAYALDPKFPRRPYAEAVSVLWRLEGKLPRLAGTELETGGSDIADDAAFFLLGKVEAWRDATAGRVDTIIREMRPDGSFPTLSRFPDVETAETAPGYCAIRVLQLLEWARYAGDLRAFAAAEQGLAYLDRLDVPRGGFYTEAPLHTPDLLSAAYLTWAYTWAYELSGKPAYLAKARRWALCGLSFVYLREDEPTMRFATVAMLGGIARKPPLEFGSARPRVGLIFANALLLLDPYERTFDWKGIAAGIVNTAERMQYDIGPEAGCLPELYRIGTRQREGLKLTPCSLVTLRLALEGKPHDLFVIANAKDRLVSPYPVTLDAGGATVHGVPAGTFFQVLHNGRTVHDVTGNGSGTDRINLD